MTEILNDDGEKVEWIKVTQTLTYNVKDIVAQLLEDNRGSDGVEITFDDVLESVQLRWNEDTIMETGVVTEDEYGNFY